MKVSVRIVLSFGSGMCQQVWHASKKYPDECSKDSPCNCIPHQFREIIPRETSQKSLDRVFPRDL